ncbi:sensor histidine kinase [Edaphobacter aggregans]|uniref:sensor histidine kinase n=1 Tax=Edaphobacter aggregans TaxID=570835 RepID=UPI000A07AD31|nr:ATP-binding protein [Edaphobacter aggregans]
MHEAIAGQGTLPSGKPARMITLVSRVGINTRLTLGFVLIIVLMSVATGILLWQSRVMRTQANRLKEMDEQFMEVQRAHAFLLSFHSESEQLVKARDLARLQQEAPALRNQLSDSRRQTETVFRGIEPNNILDPTVLQTLEAIQGLLPSQVDSLAALASVGNWEALRQRMEQPLEPFESLSAELVATASSDLQKKRSEAARQIESAQIRTLFTLPGVGGLTIIVAALLGFSITQSITRPLRSLVDGTSALAKGEFGQQVSVQGRDELAHLSRVFNQTTIKLQQLYENLRRSEQELRNVINAMPAMIWRATPRGEIDLWNRTMIEAIGKSGETSESLDLFSQVDPEQVAAVQERWRRSVQSGIPYEDAYRMLTNDGKYHWHLVRAEPFRDEGETIINWYCIAVDIDEQKQAEDHLRETRTKLGKASKIATVAELSASIAHELNQPLMSVLANAQAGKHWLTHNPPNLIETNASIDRILRDARGADETMQRIRALFKREAFEKKEANIREIVGEAVRLIREDPTKREIPIDTYLDERLPTVSVDPIQIQEVFINLISNATEAMEDIAIPPLVKVRATVTDQSEMLVQVIDHGPGVSDGENIFDAFVTTKESGMGIGLAVSRSIVEAHGGRIWAENNPDGGATFSIALPLSSLSHNPNGL